MAITALTVPYTHTAGTTAQAAQVNANNDAIKTTVNALVADNNTAAGSKTTLNARLDVELNQDGTSKAKGTAIDLVTRLAVAIANDGTIPELVAARGSKANLDTRLSVLMNADGTIPSKANISGATLTNPVLSGATLDASPATADNSVKVASTAFTQAAILAASLSGTLPNQTGNAGKVIATNGTIASWQLPFIPPQSTETISYTGGNISQIVYATGNKTVFTYTNGLLTKSQYYDTNGSTLLKTADYTYTNGSLTAVTWS